MHAPCYCQHFTTPFFFFFWNSAKCDPAGSEKHIFKLVWPYYVSCLSAWVDYYSRTQRFESLVLGIGRHIYYSIYIVIVRSLARGKVLGVAFVYIPSARVLHAMHAMLITWLLSN